MKDMSILMVIGGVITLIYINRKNIRLDFILQFKTGDEPNQKTSFGKQNADTKATATKSHELDNSNDVDIDRKHDGSLAIPVNLPAETSVFGLSKTVFERSTGKTTQATIQPNPVLPLTLEQEKTESGDSDYETEENEEEDEDDGDRGLELDGVHENPHYSLQNQLGALVEVPPMPDVPLESNESDFFRSRPGDDDVGFNEDADPTYETGISVTSYWKCIEEVHRYAQELNRLFRKRQRKKELELLTTQFLTVLTKLEMRSDANVGWLLEDFMEQLTPIHSARAEHVGMASKAGTDDPYAAFGNIVEPKDEYRDLWRNLNRLAAQQESAETVSSVPAEDDPYS